jgi:hypothetical protein
LCLKHNCLQKSENHQRAEFFPQRPNFSAQLAGKFFQELATLFYTNTCPKACCRKGWGLAGGIKPSPSHPRLIYLLSVDISKDDVTVILPFDVFFIEFGYDKLRSLFTCTCPYSENDVNLAEFKKMDQPLAFFTFLILLLISNLITWILRYTEQCYHGLINYIDTKAKCRHLKKFTCQGTLRQVFVRVYIDKRYSQSCWYFRPSFLNCCPSNLLSGSSLPPPPFPV